MAAPEATQQPATAATTGAKAQDAQTPRARQKKRHALTPLTLLQTTFLTAKLFLQNRMLSYAGACSFSFLFSFIPVFMLIAIVLLRILHASPETVRFIFSAVPELSDYINADTTIKVAQRMKSISTFEIVLGFFIFWMARRFFASVFDSLQCIFHTGQKRRALIKQVLTLAVEVTVVVTVAAVIFAYLSLRAVVHLPSLADLSAIPVVGSFLSKQYIVQLPNLLLAVLVAIVYRVASGTKPRFWLCLLAATLCTVVFWVFRYVMHMFLNTANYNLIYGVLGQLIVTLLDIFFFFIFFLIFAEFIFVVQFLDELLLAELYLLPRLNPDVPLTGGEKFRRSLFLHPDLLLARDVNALHVPKDGVLYKPGDTEQAAYYIANGYIQLRRSADDVHTYLQGEFFGEISCIIDKPRSSLAVAVTDADVIRIESSVFKTLLQHSPEASQKAIGQITSYFARLNAL